MSLYGDYIKERIGREIIEDDKGFVTYCFPSDYNDEVIYLVDMYVVPEARGDNYCSTLADKVAEIGRENDCKMIMTSLCVDARNWEISEKVITKYEFVESKRSDNMVFYIKEL